MVLPQTNELLLPLLKVIENKEEYKVQEIIDEVVDTLELSEEDLNEKMPNNEPVISSRISTANMRLKKAELVECLHSSKPSLKRHSMSWSVSCSFLLHENSFL